jgi:hypothetical protein
VITTRIRVEPPIIVEVVMAAKSKGMAGWGDLNVALNGLVREGVIVSYKTSRPEKDTPAGIEVATAKGADQAEVVKRVRQLLTGEFAEATVRTRAA